MVTYTSLEEQTTLLIPLGCFLHLNVSYKFIYVSYFILGFRYRIGPHEVESVLQTHEAVLESAAVPSPDAERGEIVKAFIVLKEAYKTKEHNDLIKEIQNHVKNQTAPYKYPRKVMNDTKLKVCAAYKISHSSKLSSRLNLLMTCRKP